MDGSDRQTPSVSSPASSRLASSASSLIHLMGLLSNRIHLQELSPGDHIYSWRNSYTYAHHGIYLGRDKIAHFTRGPGEELATGSFLDLLLASSTHPPLADCSSAICNSHKCKKGVCISCLQCFLREGDLYRFEYGVDTSTFLTKPRGGTCTMAESDAPHVAIYRALYLVQNGFGDYHIFQNNCEDFAIYCKTGLIILDTNAPGRSGQAISLLFGVPVAAVLSSFVGLAISAGLYCFTRYAVDLGVRPDVVKVPVEELAINFGWSQPESAKGCTLSSLIQMVDL